MSKKELFKQSQESGSGVQPLYVSTESGASFTPGDIAMGKKLPKKYKGQSLSTIVDTPSFGKTKRKKRKNRLKKLSYEASKPGEARGITTPRPADTEGLSTGESNAAGFSLFESNSNSISYSEDAMLDDDDSNQDKNVENQTKDKSGVFEILIDLADNMDKSGEVTLANFADFLISKFAYSKNNDPTDDFNNILVKIKRMDIPNTSEIIKKLTNIYSRTAVLEYNKSNNLKEAKEIAYKKTLHRANQYILEG